MANESNEANESSKQTDRGVPVQDEGMARQSLLDEYLAYGRNSSASQPDKQGGGVLDLRTQPGDFGKPKIDIDYTSPGWLDPAQHLENKNVNQPAEVSEKERLARVVEEQERVSNNNPDQNKIQMNDVSEMIKDPGDKADFSPKIDVQGLSEKNAKADIPEQIRQMGPQALAEYQKGIKDPAEISRQIQLQRQVEQVKGPVGDVSGIAHQIELQRQVEQLKGPTPDLAEAARQIELQRQVDQLKGPTGDLAEIARQIGIQQMLQQLGQKGKNDLDSLPDRVPSNRPPERTLTERDRQLTEESKRSMVMRTSDHLPKVELFDGKPRSGKKK